MQTLHDMVTPVSRFSPSIEINTKSWKGRYMRLSPIPVLDSDQASLLASIVGPGVAPPPPFLMWAHNVGLARWVEGLGAYCRTSSGLSPRVRILSMLVPARHFRAASMWNAHHQEALDLGFAPVELDALSRGEDPNLDADDERAFHDFATELLRGYGVSDETFARALAVFGESTLLEVVGCLGSFTLSCYALNSFRLPIRAERGWPFPDLPPTEGAPLELATTAEVS